MSKLVSSARPCFTKSGVRLRPLLAFGHMNRMQAGGLGRTKLILYFTDAVGPLLQISNKNVNYVTNII